MDYCAIRVFYFLIGIPRNRVKLRGIARNCMKLRGIERLAFAQK